MALVLLAAQQAPARQQRLEADATRRGTIRLTSKYSLDETLQKIQHAARERGMPVLAMVAPESARGLSPGQPPNTHVIVLGDAAGTTPVYQEDGETEGFGLPLQVVVSREADGRTQVTIGDPGALQLETSPTTMSQDVARSVAALPSLVGDALI